MKDMKLNKVIVIACWLVALPVVVSAQRYDTISPGSRMPGYHYSWWYDTMPVYFDTDRTTSALHMLDIRGSWLLELRSEYVEHPAAITGVGVWVVDETIDPQFSRHDICLDTSYKMPEYVHVYQYDGQRDTQYRVGSIRWDTAAPRILKIPKGEDTNRWGFLYCYLYEARTSSPIFVDSTFFLAGSFNNNVVDSTLWAYRYKPVSYAIVCWSAAGQWNVTPQRIICLDTIRNVWMPSSWVCDGGDEFGFCLAMIDYAQVDVRPNDYEMGEAGPSGELSKWRDQTIWARPYHGYRFMHWNDGCTDNPRIVPITQDTAFVAYFCVEDSHRVEARSFDDSLGYVTGGGWYYLRDTAVLVACPRMVNSRFIRWNDGDSNNSRRVYVTQDTVFVAYFDTVDMFDVELSSSDDALGYVTGSGRYCDGDTVVIRAYPRYFSSTRFVRWSDGIYFNPRNLCVTQDTVLTAIFERVSDIAQADVMSGLFTVHPNPTSDDVTISLGRVAEAPIRVTLHDAVGHEVADAVIPEGDESVSISLRELPSGTYFVALHMPDRVYMQKVVLR